MEWLKLKTDTLFIRNLSATIIVTIFVTFGLSESYNDPSRMGQQQKLTKFFHVVSMGIVVKSYQILRR